MFFLAPAEECSAVVPARALYGPQYWIFSLHFSGLSAHFFLLVIDLFELSFLLGSYIFYQFTSQWSIPCLAHCQ